MVQKDLDIAEYTDPLHNPMIPYTLVLEPGLIIYKIYMGYWFFSRPTVEDLRLDLRAVLKNADPTGTLAEITQMDRSLRCCHCHSGLAKPVYEPIECSRVSVGQNPLKVFDRKIWFDFQ